MALICWLLAVYSLVVIFYVILRMIVDFMRILKGHPVRQISDTLEIVVEPVLRRIRSFLPSVPMGGLNLDLSPIVLLVGLAVIRGILC